MQTRNVLSYDERKRFEARCKYLEDQLYADTMRRQDSPSSRFLSDEGKHYKIREREKLRKILKADKIETSLNAYERHKIWKRIGELKRIITLNLIPRRYMRGEITHINGKIHTKPINRIVNKQVELDAKYKHIMREYKYLSHKLEPTNPDAGNLEYLRPE